jgi:NAD(P)-dependent dehydrogenase (short-subunit alcohol dehydrogenase family)
MASSPSCVVLGVGPGTGAAVARRFAKAGLGVAVAARRPESLDPVVRELAVTGNRVLPVVTDAVDERSVSALIERTERELGPIEVAVYNASGRVIKSVLDLSAAEVTEAWQRSCLGGFLFGREAARRMVERGSGTLLFTGATAGMRGGANFAAFAIGKFGLRALAQSMARELGPRGLHVAYVNIDGPINTGASYTIAMAKDRPPAGLLEPDAIAEAYFQLHRQHRSAWTQELDLRPWVEKF